MARPSILALLALAALLATAARARAEEAAPPPPAPAPPPAPPPAPAPAPKPPPAPTEKEADLPDDVASLLDLAMRANPEILVAEAKVAQAEAEAHAARLRVSQAVLEGRAQREQAAARRAEVESRLKRVEDRVRNGVTSLEEAAAARREAAEAKAAEAEAVARLRYLCGIGGGPQGTGPWLGAWVRSRVESGRLVVSPPTGGRVTSAAWPAGEAPRYAEALDRPITLPPFKDWTLEHVLEVIQAEAKVVVIVDRVAFTDTRRVAVLETTFSLALPGPVPLRTALEAVADSVGCTLVPRRYGALLTDRVPPTSADDASAGPR